MSAPDLLEILSHPFQRFADPEVSESEEQSYEPTADEVLQMKAADVYTGSGLTVSNYAEYANPITEVLHPHIHTANSLLQSIKSASSQSAEVKQTIEENAHELERILESIVKGYKVYISTASGESLEKEAKRLERRYFQNQGIRAQIEFIQLKRFFEKVRTFNDQAKTSWRDVYKLTDTLSLIEETARIVRGDNEASLREVFPLMRKTDAFLEALSRYLKTEEETKDSITGSVKISLTYDSKKRYTIQGFLGNESVENLEDEEQGGEESSSLELEEQAENEKMDFEGSIARNIIIESKEHRLNSASVISVPILGSRDWNRTPDYRMEIQVSDYEEAVEHFTKAVHITISADESIARQIVMNPLSYREHRGAAILPEYQRLIQDSLTFLSDIVVDQDFPGLYRPDVFLYHCGPPAFLSMIESYFLQMNIGEIFYPDGSGNILREFPHRIIKKELILWWIQRFSSLNREDIDSYITFSGFIEMVKKDYRVLEEEGSRLRKRENPGAGYNGLDKWLRDNRNRVFGFRKVEIFKRFLTYSVFTRNQSKADQL